MNCTCASANILKVIKGTIRYHESQSISISVNQILQIDAILWFWADLLCYNIPKICRIWSSPSGSFQTRTAHRYTKNNNNNIPKIIMKEFSKYYKTFRAVILKILRQE